MNKWPILFCLVAIIGGAFFIKKEPFTAQFESAQSIYLKDSLFDKVKFDSDEAETEYRLGTYFLSESSLHTSLYAFKKAETLSQTAQDKTLCTFAHIYTLYQMKAWDSLEKLYKEGAFEKIDPMSIYHKDMALIFYHALKIKNTPFLFPALKRYLESDPSTCFNLSSSEALALCNFEHPIFEKGPFKERLDFFLKNKKSEKMASFLNLSLFGSGYLYLGQKQTALTALLVLSFLSLATLYSIKKRHFASSIILFTVFCGFYWGSINGAKLSASFYNKKLYENLYLPLVISEKLNIDLMIEHAP